MTGAALTYFAIVDDARTRTDPLGLVRRIHTAPVPTDQALGRNMQWHATEYLCRYWLGHNDVDHVEISVYEAQLIIDRWLVNRAEEDVGAQRIGQWSSGDWASSSDH